MSILLYHLICLFVISLSFYIGFSMCKEKNEYTTINKSIIDLVRYFVIVSASILLCLFVISDDDIYEDGKIPLGDIFDRFLIVSAIEVAVTVVVFVPILYRKFKKEMSYYRMKDYFIESALKYGVNNGHFEPSRKYEVRRKLLHLKAPDYYIKYWSREYLLDEYILTNVETKEEIVMSEFDLWMHLCPMGGPNDYLIKPWEVNFPKGEYLSNKYYFDYYKRL